MDSWQSGRLKHETAVTRARRFPLGAILAFPCLIIAGLSPAVAETKEPERYAYMFLQGKVGGVKPNRPEGGVTVRLISTTRSFETKTDDRGVFVFERLPVAAYELEIVTADGRVMRSMRSFDDPRGIRLEVRTGKGQGKRLQIDPKGAGGRLGFVVPEHAPDWGRFWTEVGIVVGAAGILLL
jgi:hypothetical protein